MPLQVNINQNSPNAVPTNFDDNGDANYLLGSNNNCWAQQSNSADGSCGGGCQSNYGILQANRILEEWGIHYTPSASPNYEDDWLRSIPFNLVRNPESEWNIHCDDLQSILVVSGNMYSNAQDRYDMCGGFDVFCKCNANIDRRKWKAIFDWAEIAVQYKSSENDIDSCIVEQFQDANLQITQSMEDMLEEKEGLGLKPETLLAIVAGATLTTIGLILKFVK